MSRLTPRLSVAVVALALALVSPAVAAAAELETVARGDGTQEPTRANFGSIPGVQAISAALHGATGTSSGGTGAAAAASSSSSSSATASAASPTSTTETKNSTTKASSSSSSSSSFSSYPFPASIKLGHFDPPTTGCNAALLNNPAYTQVPQPDGSIRFYLPWTTWPCMNGAQVRTFLTAKKLDEDDRCKTLDAGFEISSWALNATNLPTAAQANACRPPYCAHFGGKVNGTLCQQPFLRDYFQMPAVGTHFQPFEVAQLDWEPEGHAPMGVYSDPHVSFFFF